MDKNGVHIKLPACDIPCLYKGQQSQLRVVHSQGGGGHGEGTYPEVRFYVNNERMHNNFAIEAEQRYVDPQAYIDKLLGERNV